MISRRTFGKLSNGHVVHAFDLTSDTGLRAVVLEYGAILQSLRLPCGLDVVLGFDDLTGYLGPHPCFGAAIGRLANRTRGAAFTIEDTRYLIPANEGANNLHGGPDGFDRAIWKGEIQDGALILTHVSPDGHQGFPGRVEAQMTFKLSGNTLSLDMQAHADKATPINLTHHSYFNLTDGGKTSALDHDLTVLCEDYLDLDSANIPTGQILKTAGGSMDFQTPKSVTQSLDDCFVKHHDASNQSVKKLAKLVSNTTGNMMIICGTQPALQVYSGSNIQALAGKYGTIYGPNHGIALEPQNFPNAVNEKSFPSPLIGPEKLYHHTIRYTVKAAKPS